MNSIGNLTYSVTVYYSSREDSSMVEVKTFSILDYELLKQVLSLFLAEVLEDVNVRIVFEQETLRVKPVDGPHRFIVEITLSDANYEVLDLEGVKSFFHSCGHSSRDNVAFVYRFFHEVTGHSLFDKEHKQESMNKFVDLFKSSMRPVPPVEENKKRPIPANFVQIRKERVSKLRRLETEEETTNRVAFRDRMHARELERRREAEEKRNNVRRERIRQERIQASLM